jgi:hypothetical protein
MTIQPPKRRVFSLIKKIRTMDKVQKRILFIQQPSSEPFRTYLTNNICLAQVIKVIPTVTYLFRLGTFFFNFSRCHTTSWAQIAIN